MNPDQTVLDYVRAWSTSDETERRALLQRAWTDGGVYCDPRSRVEGRAALNEHIAAFQRQRPGSRIPLASGVDAHHDVVRFRWVLLDESGQVALEGFDVGELDLDGRLKRINGFFGPFPPIPAVWPAWVVYR